MCCKFLLRRVKSFNQRHMHTAFSPVRDISNLHLIKANHHAFQINSSVKLQYNKLD